MNRMLRCLTPFVALIPLSFFQSACGSDDGAADGTPEIDTADTAVDTAADTVADSAADSVAPPDTAPEVEVTPAEDYEEVWEWTLGGLTPTDYEASLDETVTWSGSGVSRKLSSVRADTLGSGNVGVVLPVGDYGGLRVRLHARVRSEDVTGFAALSFGTGISRAGHARANTGYEAPIRGTADWTEMALELDVDAAVDTLYVSLSLENAGTVWIDDTRLEVVPRDGPDDDLNARAPQTLDMESDSNALGVPAGWIRAGSAPFLYTFAHESEVVHGGDKSFSLSSTQATASDFATLMQIIHADDYVGQRLRLRAWVRSEAVEEFAGLWMRIDGWSGMLGFDNMQNRPILGTNDWTEHAVVLDVPDGAILIAFGALQAGNGTLWFDDFTLEVVDETVPETDGQ